MFNKRLKTDLFKTAYGDSKGVTEPCLVLLLCRTFNLECLLLVFKYAANVHNI